MRKNKRSSILKAIYETACDLHSCRAFTDEQMKKYEELAPKPEPIKIDYGIFDFLNKRCDSNREKLPLLVNDLLRKELEIPRAV